MYIKSEIPDKFSGGSFEHKYSKPNRKRLSDNIIISYDYVVNRALSLFPTYLSTSSRLLAVL